MFHRKSGVEDAAFHGGDAVKRPSAQVLLLLIHHVDGLLTGFPEGRGVQGQAVGLLIDNFGWQIPVGGEVVGLHRLGEKGEGYRPILPGQHRCLPSGVGDDLGDAVVALHRRWGMLGVFDAALRRSIEVLIEIERRRAVHVKVHAVVNKIAVGNAEIVGAEEIVEALDLHCRAVILEEVAVPGVEAHIPLEVRHIHRSGNVVVHKGAADGVEIAVLIGSKGDIIAGKGAIENGAAGAAVDGCLTAYLSQRQWTQYSAPECPGD